MKFIQLAFIGIQLLQSLHAATHEDTLRPSLSSVEYFSNTTLALSDDILKITFTRNLDDASLPVFFNDIFQVNGTARFTSSNITTGITANDNIIEIFVNSSDTIPAQTGDRLILIEGAITSIDLISCTADTDSIVCKHVVNINKDEAYPTIMEANNNAAAGDTIIVTTGIYTDSIRLRSVTLKAADPDVERPVLQYTGRHFNLTSREGYEAFICVCLSAHPLINGFIINGTSIHEESDRVAQAIYFPEPNAKIRNCIINGANIGVGGGALIESCVISDCKFGIKQNLMDKNIYPVFRNNTVYDCDNGFYLYEGDNRIVEANEIYSCNIGIYMRQCHNAAFTNNLIHNNKIGLYLYSPYCSNHTNWISNTVVYNRQNGLIIQGSCGAVLKYNILYGNGSEDTTTFMDLAVSADEAESSELITQNLIGRPSSKLVNLFAMQQSSGNIFGTDPRFADPASQNYHLGLLSSATDCGGSGTDYDNSPADWGAFGGSNALDNKMPEVINNLKVIRQTSVDTLVWSESPAVDFKWYAIYRQNIDSGMSVLTPEDLVDTINIKSQTSMVANNYGSKWIYTIQVMDSSGNASGFASIYSTTTGEILISSEEPIDFGIVGRDSVEYRTLEIKNVGAANLTIRDISIFRNSPVHIYSDTYKTELLLPFVIAPGDQKMIVLAFNPDSFYVINDSLAIVSDDSDPGDSLITWRITGETAQEEVYIPINNLSYGSIYLGNESGCKYFNILNKGNGALIIDRIWYAIGKHFLTTSKTDSIILAPLVSFQMETFCIPNDTGILDDTIFIKSSDPVTPLLFSTLTATAYDSSGISINNSAFQNIDNHMNTGPNPAKNQVKINFSLKRSQKIEVSVYNASGLRLMQLASGVFPAGSNTVRWSGDLAPGQYLVTVEGNGIWYTAQVTVSR